MWMTLKQDVGMKKFPLGVITLLTASALITAGQLPALANEATLKVTEIASISSGDGEGSSEIAAFHAGSKRIFATNGVKNTIDIFDISDVANPKKVGSVALSPYGNDVTSVAAGKDVVVAVVNVSDKFSATGVPTTTNGKIVVFEANAIGRLNIGTATFESVTRAFESKVSRVARDTSDRDAGAGPRTYTNVVGASQPDAIAGFTQGSGQYFVTANEGDAREYTCLNDDLRGSALKVDARRFPDWKTLSGSAALGRAKVNPTIGDKDGDGDIDTIHLRGSNSMTMYRNGIVIWDSADLLDQIQTKAFGVANINGSHSLSSDKSTMNFVGQDRSDDKGAEPEGVAVGMVGDRRIAILGLERMTALAIFDITEPGNPVFQEWLQMLPTKATPAKDVKHWSPEGIVFVPANKSPSGKALIITSYELSGSLSIHQIEPRN